MVMPRERGVHAQRPVGASRPAFPQDASPRSIPRRLATARSLPPRPIQSWGINCAHTAIIPMNSVIDASAAASSTKIFNIAASLDERTNEEQCSFFVPGVKAEVVGQFEK